MNFGGIGVVIGHELTHGFDDEGRQFDADGNLRDWWQKQDSERFDKLADCEVKEYGAFSPIEGVKLNGKLTLGENTADNGGLRLAYYALMNQLIEERCLAVSQGGWIYRDPAILSWFCAGLVQQHAGGSGAAACQDGPALTRQVPRRWGL